MNELIDFLIDNEINFTEHEKTIRFNYGGNLFLFDFRIKSFEMVFGVGRITVNFVQFDCIKDGVNNYIEVFSENENNMFIDFR